jgi:ferredoxin-type protein NapH
MSCQGGCDIQQQQKSKYTLRWVMSGVFVALVVAGWFVPWFGYFIPVCMIGGLSVAFFAGRKWCDWWCGRGSFLENVVGAVSSRRRIPSFLRSTAFRVAIMAVLFGMFGTRIALMWGEWAALGGFFVTFLTATTVVAIALGIIFEPRAWCAFCPIGTLSKWAGAGKKPLLISDACRGCRLCEKACPMGIEIASYADQGVVANADCIKCGACIAKCPIGVLSFDSTTEQAA